MLSATVSTIRPSVPSVTSYSAAQRRWTYARTLERFALRHGANPSYARQWAGSVITLRDAHGPSIKCKRLFALAYAELGSARAVWSTFGQSPYADEDVATYNATVKAACPEPQTPVVSLTVEGILIAS